MVSLAQDQSLARFIQSWQSGKYSDEACFMVSHDSLTHSFFLDNVLQIHMLKQRDSSSSASNVQGNNTGFTPVDIEAVQLSKSYTEDDAV